MKINEIKIVVAVVVNITRAVIKLYMKELIFFVCLIKMLLLIWFK